MGHCELCGREGAPLTRHHLIPRSRVHGRLRKEQKQAALERIAMLCRACHRFAHVTLTEREMASGYGSIAALRAHPEIAKFVDWIRTKPPGYQPHTRRRQAG